MEVIIRDSKWIVGSEQLKPESRFWSIRAYMDDLKTVTASVSYSSSKEILKELDEN